MGADTTCWPLIRAVLGAERRILLYGKIPGTGKTYAGQMYRRPGQRVFSITLTPDMPMQELRGHHVPRGGEFVWMDGPAVTARYRTPNARLLINELHHRSADVEAFLHALLDDDKESTITLPTGEVLTAAEGTEIIATMNEDPSTLSDALRDRFIVKIDVDCVNPEALASLPTDLRDAAVALATHDDPERRVGMRALKGFAELRTRVAPEIAARAIFGDRATDILDALTVHRAYGPKAGK